MSITTVEILDAGAAEARLAAIRRQVQDVDDFTARGAAYELDLEDRVLYEELRDLEFLLGDD